MSDGSLEPAALALELAGASSEEAGRLVVAALGSLAERLCADRSYVTVYLGDGTFRNMFEWTAEGIVPQLPVIQRLRSDEFSYSYRLAEDGVVLAVPDVSQLPDDGAAERASFSSFGVAAVLQVPIVVDGVGVGLVGINHYAVVDGWSDDDVEAVRHIGRAIGVAVIRERADDATRRAEEALEDTRRARNELLAHVSHELRTPLHGLLGYAELLELNEEREADRRAVSQIGASGRRLLAMVDDLIDLAESSDGRVGDIALMPLFDMSFDGLAPAARQRDVTIVAGPGLAGATVRAEPGRARQVLYCAISGAVQAVDQGGTVVVDAEPAGIDERSCVVTLAIEGGYSVGRPGMVVPLARTLVEGHGSIDLAERPGGFDVRIEFDADR